jgi:hypothetical protein
MIRSAAYWITSTSISIGLAWTPTCARDFGSGSTACTSAFLFSTANVFVEGSTNQDVPCTISYGTHSDILAYSVVQRPHHGVLGSAGREGERFLTAYNPNAGYVGADEFAVKLRFSPRSTHVEATTVVHVHMTIRP